MYKEGMTDNDRSNKLQKWILNLRLNADEVSYLLNKVLRNWQENHMLK